MKCSEIRYELGSGRYMIIREYARRRWWWRAFERGTWKADGSSRWLWKAKRDARRALETRLVP